MDDWSLTSVAPFSSNELEDKLSDNSSILREWEFDAKLIQALHITFAILDALIGCTANSFLLLVIISSGSLRANMRNVLIANLAAADLLVDVIISPIAADFHARDNWIHGCYAQIFFQFLHVIAFSFLSMWGMITIDVLLLVRVARTSPLTSLVTFSLPVTPALWRRRLKLALKIVVVAFPWLLAGVSTVPVFVLGNEAFWNNLQPETDILCIIPNQMIGMTHYNVLFFILPISFLSAIFVAVISICLYRRLTKRVLSPFPTSHLQTTIMDMAPVSASASATTSEPGRAAAATSPPQAATIAATTIATTTTRCREMESKQESINPYVVATIVTVVMVGAKHVLHMHNAIVHLPILVAVHILTNLKSAVLPFVWLLMMSDLKDQARRLLKSWRDTLLRVKPSSPTEVSVDYTTLSDN